MCPLDVNEWESAEWRVRERKVLELSPKILLFVRFVSRLPYIRQDLASSVFF